MLGSKWPSAGPSTASPASNFDRKVKATVASSTFVVPVSLVLVFALALAAVTLATPTPDPDPMCLEAAFCKRETDVVERVVE